MKNYFQWIKCEKCIKICRALKVLLIFFTNWLEHTTFKMRVRVNENYFEFIRLTIMIVMIL